MSLHADDRRDLEDARERLEGVYRRTRQVETRLTLEAVQRVLERDDHPLHVLQVEHPRPPLCPDGGLSAGAVPGRVHHHRPLEA